MSLLVVILLLLAIGLVISQFPSSDEAHIDKAGERR